MSRNIFHLTIPSPYTVWVIIYLVIMIFNIIKMTDFMNQHLIKYRVGFTITISYFSVLNKC